MAAGPAERCVVRDAPMEASSASISRSVASYPCASATSIGKNVTSATSMILGVSPKPNHSTISGAMATSGTVWLMTNTGISARRSGLKKSMRTENTKAAASEQAKPSSVALSVGIVFSNRASRCSMAWPSTRDGAGRVVGEMPEKVA